MSSNQSNGAARGSIRVAVAERERRGVPAGVRLTILIVTAVLTSTAVILAGRYVFADSTTPRSTLDPKSAAAAAGLPGAAEVDPTVPGSTRLALLGPIPLLDSRAGAALAPGAEVMLPVPPLPPGSTALLVEVSLVAATRPGTVAVTSSIGEVTVLRLARAGYQQTATAVVPIGADNSLRARTEGGGKLVVNLVGAFEPAAKATAGRIVAVPPAEVLRLIPRTDGKNGTVDLGQVPTLPGGAAIAAVLLQVNADVGPLGGFVSAGASAAAMKQTFFWSATAGADRTRNGFLVVPVSQGSVHLHYEAGTELRVDLVGYVTDATAPSTVAGLVVPVPTARPVETQIAAGGEAAIAVVPRSGINTVPAPRIGAALLGVTATGNALGTVSVFAPPSEPSGGTPASPSASGAPPATQAAGLAGPTLNANAGSARSVLTLVRIVDGTVRANATGGAAVTVLLQAVILTD